MPLRGTSGPESQVLTAYFLRDGKMVVAHRQETRGDAVGALAALMQGLTGEAGP